MPLDIALTGLALPMAEFPALAREAEARGYRTAWVGEASGAEAIVLSTLIATHTTTIKIANGVMVEASGGEQLRRRTFDPWIGWRAYEARELAAQSGLTGRTLMLVSGVFEKLSQAFLACDAVVAEIIIVIGEACTACAVIIVPNAAPPSFAPRRLNRPRNRSSARPTRLRAAASLITRAYRPKMRRINRNSSSTR
jgi:hypothetical protein